MARQLNPMGRCNPAEPSVEIEPSMWRATSWSEVDDAAAAALGADGVAIPSIRVAIGWVMEYSGYRRHRDQALVPRFLGRCVLNAVNRHALPVEQVTPLTKVALAVDQFGFRQDYDAVGNKCRELSLQLIADSPYGVGADERPHAACAVRLVGFSKVLPVLKGGFAVSADAALLAYFKTRREEYSRWSWVVLALLVYLRADARRDAATLSEIAYELFPRAAGDNRVFRSNMRTALLRWHVHENATRERLDLLQNELGEAVLVPDARRVASFALLPCEDPALAAEFTKMGFDGTLYHFDAHRNIFTPAYTRVLLLPLSSTIPMASFTGLVRMLSARGARRAA